MTFDVRMMGSGMPFAQANFQISGTGLGTAPLPLLTTADNSSFTFRRNPLGNITQLTANFLPAAGSLTMNVASTADLAVGDVIYINDFIESGTGGLRGTIASKTATSITLNNSYVTSAATTFKAGSLVERVQDISYVSSNTWSGITRNDGSGVVVLGRNSTFSISYYDKAGTLLTLPLTEAAIRDNLTSVQLTVSVRSTRKLRDGSLYTAQMHQRVGLRNLYLTR